MRSFKVIICLGFCSFLNVFGCVQNETEVKSKSQLTQQKQRANTTKIVQFGHESSPLQSTELSWQDFPKEVVLDVLSGEEVLPSNQSTLEQAVAVGNLLRSPCLGEWNNGQTLNQSIKEGHCTKSVEWMKSVYTSIVDGESLDDVLFKMVSPGPYDPQMDKEIHTVVISTEMLKLKMFHERRLHLESVSQHALSIIVTATGKSYSLNRECLNDGQELSVDVDFEQCLKDTVSTEVKSVLKKDSSLSKPVWYVNGYRFSGFQSTKQLSHTLTLP